MKKNKFLGSLLAVCMAAGTVVFPVSAQASAAELYSGDGSVTVTADPTGSGKGNVFFINGYDTSRGYDKEMGANPYIGLDAEYLYDTDGGKYTLKNDFSVSYDIYSMSRGYRYAFYTGTDDISSNGMSGLYYIPDTGSVSYIEGFTGGEWVFKQEAAQYESIKGAWHNITFSRKDDKYSVTIDGKPYIEAESDYTYSLDREPITRIGYSPYTADSGIYAYIDNISVTNGSDNVYFDTADGEYTINTYIPPKPETLIVNDGISDGSETQKLIDSRPDIQRRAENLDRGLVAVSSETYGFISWRWLGTESADTLYNLYKNGEKLNAEPLNATSYIDYAATPGDKYTVTSVYNGAESEPSKEAALLDKSYIEIPLKTPEGGTVTLSDGTEEAYTYNANDATTADLDGDGEYEIIIKWDPSNSRDSSHLGATGNTLFDAYKLDGTFMWRIDLGINIRSGAHDTQMLAADFDGDGKGELAMRTADGTVAGDGAIIGDASKDWRDANGKNLTGPLYITVFDGETGAAEDTVDYIPQSQGAYGDNAWDIKDWGDDWGNRSERYNAAVVYLDGVNPSMLFARGYYDRTVLATFSMKDGKIVSDWLFDTFTMGEEGNKYKAKGNHAVSIADVDYDGCDEIIYGSETFDSDGSVMYVNETLGHGDAQHVGDFLPSRPGLEIFTVHEHGANGQELKDARTGEFIWYSPFGSMDVGRGACDDIDPRYPGAESWSSMGMLVAADGTLITDRYSIPANFLSWWDGDLGREILDGITISKWNPFTSRAETIFSADGCHSNNAAKSNPSLTADLLGDWREEAVYPALDNSALRIYTTTTPTSYRIPALMHDTQYRAAVAEQNVGYNQPAHVSYNLGYDTKTIPVPQIYVNDNGTEIRNPDLEKKSWDINTLYSGNTVTLAIGENKALINGAAYYIDSDESVVPYEADDRTFVPYRFLAEAFGANVSWNGGTQSVIVKKGGSEIRMDLGSAAYTVNGEIRIMDTIPALINDRTFVPLRFAAEALGFNVGWDEESKVITISDLTADISNEEAAAVKAELPSLAAMAPAGTRKYENGEKIVSTQANVIKTDTSSGNGAAAFDLDYSTFWQADGGSILQAELDGYYAISSVYVAFADGKAHNFKVYTKWDLGEDDKDLSNRDGWAEAVSASSSGETSDPEIYIFPVPKYGNYIKIITEDGDSAQISEIAAVIVQ